MEFSLKTLIFFLLTLLPLTTSTTIGTTFNNHPNSTSFSVEALTATLTRLKLTSLRLTNPDPNLIRSFTYSPISLLITIPNSLIPSLASNQSNAATWLYSHVVPFYPRANITTISVGTDVMSSPNDVINSVIPAIRNLHVGLRQLGIRKISISTTFSVISTLSTVFPPSSAEFQEPVNEIIIRPLLDFLEEANSPFLIKLYPYEIYRDVSHEIPIGFALFQDYPFNYRDDPTTGVRYRNLFDVMVDAVLAAMAIAGHENIPVVVVETGWPCSPGADNAIAEESDANSVFAELYLSGLVKHLKSGKGTPLKKDGVSEVYLFELFDKEVNKSQGVLPVKQWGILYPNLTSKYKIDFSGSSEFGRFLWVLIVISFMALGFL